MSRHWRAVRRIPVALVASCAAGSALAEPYSGNPTDDPLVLVVAWAILCLGAAVIALPIALLASHGQLRSGRFAVSLATAFLLVLGLATLVGAPRMAKEIVSLVLHLLF